MTPYRFNYINETRKANHDEIHIHPQDLETRLNEINPYLVNVQDNYPSSHLNTMVNVIIAVIFSPLTARQCLGHQARPQLISDSTLLRDRGGRNAALMFGAKQDIEVTVANVKKELGIEPDGKVTLKPDPDTNKCVK